jgi:hypothetical protein
VFTEDSFSEDIDKHRQRLAWPGHSWAASPRDL